MNEFNDLRLLKESDIFMVPLCLLVLYCIAYATRKKYRGTELEKYFMPALWLRFLFALIYAMIIQYYYGYGDTSLYYQAVADMRNAMMNDPEIWKEIFLKQKLTINSPLYSYFMYDNGAFTHLYMMNVSNYMVPRFALPFSFAFSNSYLCICFCLSMFSFAGCWRVFKMVTEIYPHLHKKFAIAILYLPSVLFWGGSLLKDSICMGSMGLALYAIYNIVLKKRNIPSSLIILLFTFFLLYNIKPYIILCLVPAFLLWLFLQFRTRIPDKTLRTLAGFLFTIISVVVGVIALQSLTQSEMTSQYSSEKILKTVQGMQGSFKMSTEGAGSSFSVGAASSSALGTLALFPLGFFTTLFRPFLWEARNPLMIISALEGLLFLYLTYLAFKKIGFRKFFSIAGSDSVVVFCLVYSVLFAGIIGVTTTNFGALVRYKIPCVPFYLFMLFIVMDKSGKFSPGIVFSRKFF